MIQIDIAPVAVKFLETLPELDLPRQATRSFCEALSLVRSGEIPGGLLVTPESIAVCAWSPVALGFREPLNDSDAAMPSVHPGPVAAVLLYNYGSADLSSDFREVADPPDSIVLVADEDNSRAVVESLGIGEFDTRYVDRQEFCALPSFSSEVGPQDPESVRKRRRRARRTFAMNRIFASGLMQTKRMVHLVTRLMSKRWMQKLMTWLSFNKTVAGSSCFVSTSMPRVSGKAHIGYVDVGSVGWGHVNPRRFLTGVTPEQYNRLQPDLAPVSHG